MFKQLHTIIAGIRSHPLAGKHPITACRKFIAWQLWQMLSPGIKKMRFVEGTFLPAKKGMAGATGNIYCGLHEFEDMAFLLHFLRSEDTFIDAGANIGSYTVLASGVCRAYSVSFEPVPSTFAHLQNSIRINNLEAFSELHNAAAGATAGQIKFTSGLDTVNHVLAAGEEDTTAFTEVPVVTLDEALAGKKNVRLIKIDTEGFETPVIEGMLTLMDNKELKAVIIELNGSGGRYGFDERKIHDTFLSEGFAAYSYEPFSRKLTSLPSFGSLNTIYLRDMDFVLQRIASAKKINLFSESF